MRPTGAAKLSAGPRAAGRRHGDQAAQGAVLWKVLCLLHIPAGGGTYPGTVTDTGQQPTGLAARPTSGRVTKNWQSVLPKSGMEDMHRSIALATPGRT